MSVSLVIPAGEREICFNMSIDTSEMSSVSLMQILLVLNIADGTLAVPGMNNTLSFNISSEANSQGRKNSMSYISLIL